MGVADDSLEYLTQDPVKKESQNQSPMDARDCNIAGDGI